MRFVGNEGAAFGAGSVVFTESDGGPDELGQVWRYTPARGEGHDDAGPRRARRGGGTLELLFRSGDEAVTLNPDNIVVSQRGAVLFAEDGDGEGVDGVRPEYVKLITGPASVEPFCASQVRLDVHLHNLGEDDPEDQLPVGAPVLQRVQRPRLRGRLAVLRPAVPRRDYAITGPWQRARI
jgi:hypothetical protein